MPVKKGRFYKKSISPLIATVLIIGFTVSIAAVIVLWAGTFTKGMSERTEEIKAEAMICSSDMSFDIQSVSFEPGNVKLLLVNDGGTDIKGFMVRFFGKSATSATSLSGLAPAGIQSYDIDYTNYDAGELQKIEVSPMLEVAGKQVSCSNAILDYELEQQDMRMLIPAQGAVCGDGYCYAEGGETEATCCADCGCTDSHNLYCHNNACHPCNPDTHEGCAAPNPACSDTYECTVCDTSDNYGCYEPTSICLNGEGCVRCISDADCGWPTVKRKCYYVSAYGKWGCKVVGDVDIGKCADDCFGCLTDASGLLTDECEGSTPADCGTNNDNGLYSIHDIVVKGVFIPGGPISISLGVYVADMLNGATVYITGWQDSSLLDKFGCYEIRGLESGYVNLNDVNAVPGFSRWNAASTHKTISESASTALPYHIRATIMPNTAAGLNNCAVQRIKNGGGNNGPDMEDSDTDFCEEAQYGENDGIDIQLRTCMDDQDCPVEYYCSGGKCTTAA